MKTAAAERALLLEAGTGLVEIADRMWIASRNASVSYPAEAHSSLAQIEATSFWFAHRNDVINTVLARFAPAGPIVDVGGGNGFVSSDLVRRGHSCIVIEPGDDAARIAHHRGLTVVKAPFDRMLFRPGAVAALGLFDVIEHNADDVGFLADCLDVLAPGGHVYVTVPALRWLWSSDDDYAGHQRRYSRSTLAHALARAGFDVRFVSYFFSALVPPLFLLRTLPSALGLRKVTTPKDAVGHHSAGGRLANFARRAFAFERAAIGRDMTLPFGTSLVAVARRRAS